METPSPGTDFYLDGEPHVAPGRLVEHYCATRGIAKAELGIRPVVLGTFSARLTRYLGEAAGAEKAEHLAEWRDTDAYVVGDALTILTFGIGAPATVAAMEEMAACGMHTLITTGAAGSLQESAPIGSVVVPTAAIREEGTSHHYAPKHVPAEPDEELAAELAQEAARRGIECARGVNWTTDAVYQEHRQKIERHRRAGVVTVDMELSALSVVSAIRRVRCAAILAVSDELHGAEWELGFQRERFMQGMVAAADVALAVALRRSQDAAGV
jgi:uridine phosphorylase